MLKVDIITATRLGLRVLTLKTVFSPAQSRLFSASSLLYQMSLHKLSKAKLTRMIGRSFVVVPILFLAKRFIKDSHFGKIFEAEICGHVCVDMYMWTCDFVES